MKIIILLLISSICFGQAKDTTKSKPVIHQAATDSTGLITIKDVQAVAKYLEDKMLAKDYNLIMSILSQLIESRAKEYAIKQKKP